jgi:hypothetical protein
MTVHVTGMGQQQKRPAHLAVSSQRTRPCEVVMHSMVTLEADMLLLVSVCYWQ